jgi:hypothetical protein
MLYISITYSEYVSVALGTQPAMRMRHIAIRVLPGPTVFFHIVSQMARFSKKLLKFKMCFFIFSATLCETFSFK